MRPEAAYLCVHVPEFPAQAMLRLRPELKGRAIAVLEGVAPFERVCSVNRLAAAMGVRAGMTKAELDSFDGLVVLRRSADEESSAKAAVMEVAGAFTPRVEDHTEGEHGTDGACVVVLDGSGTGRLFGPLEDMAKRVMRAMRQLRMAASVAVSANLLASVVVARALAGRRDAEVRVVPGGEERSALAGLPMAVLKLTREQMEMFGAWGLRTVGELAALDETELVVRMGQEGARLWRLARGRAEHLMVPAEAGLQLEEVVEFDAAVEGMESLLFVLGPMLDQLIARAANRALALASVTLTLGLDGHSAEGDALQGPGGEHVRMLKPALPVADRGLYLKLLHLDLEAHPPGAGVVRVRVMAEAGGRSSLQAGLFRPQMPEPGRLEVTLARIEALVGEGRVGRARLRDSHAPESFSVERFVLPEMGAERRREGRLSREGRQELIEKKLRALEQATTTREVKAAAEDTPASARSVATEIWAEQGRTGSGAERGSVKVLQMLPLKPVEEVLGDGEGRAGRDAGRCAVAVRRMRPPVPIRWKGERESAFWMQGVLYDVRERYGPWRRSGAWWTGEVWSQEEWDVTVEAGKGIRLLCLLTHDLLRDRWHMDAMYD